MSQLVLASASPQRKRLLEGLNISFAVHPSALDESQCTEADPLARCAVLAKLKAQAVAGEYPDSFVLGCDTLVVASDGTLCEKPADADAARAMLQLLSGGTCVVHSALHLIAPDGNEHDGIDSTQVTFRKLSDDDLDWWVSTNLWQDRSGGFQIEGKGQLLAEKLEGDWTGVVGLPVHLLGRMLDEVGFTPLP